MKKWQKFAIWFGYFALVMAAYELHVYFAERNLSGEIYIFIIENIFWFLGWLGAILEIKLRNKEK